MPVYFTEARIDEMKKDYVQKNPDKLSPRALARKVDCSLMTIYRYIGTTTSNDPGLSDGNN
jgi:DNA invertase Pin-like site-specific DNA recombinase